MKMVHVCPTCSRPLESLGSPCPVCDHERYEERMSDALHIRTIFEPPRFDIRRILEILRRRDPA
jgi:RNA polymerase subunit RPABC4/transcription elongation factor Spt4